MQCVASHGVTAAAVETVDVVSFKPIPAQMGYNLLYVYLYFCPRRGSSQKALSVLHVTIVTSPVNNLINNRMTSYKSYLL